MKTFEIFTTEDLGRAIRQLRKERGWTQAELAEWLGVSTITAGRMEHGAPVSIKGVIRAISLLGAKVIITHKGTPLASFEKEASDE
jgi:transcriptional regulator with XRE-family HTH domain